MNTHLSDILERAGRDDAPLVPPAQARADAARHRARRRLSAVTAVAVVAAGVAVAGNLVVGPRLASVVPASPSPTPTATAAPSPSTPSPPSPTTSPPSPTTSPASPTTSPPKASASAPSGTEPAGPPPLTRAEAQAGVERLRFVPEDEWRADEAYPLPDLPHDQWVTSACSSAVPLTGSPLAARTLGHVAVEHPQSRQVVVYEDAAAAAAGFAEMRAAMRACQQQPRVTTHDGVDGNSQTRTITVLGGQLDLGDESFWVADKEVITADEGNPVMVGEEMFWSVGQMYVLDDNVVTVLLDLAAYEEGRQRFVAEASAEWEQFRPAYEALRRP